MGDMDRRKALGISWWFWSWCDDGGDERYEDVNDDEEAEEEEEWELAEEMERDPVPLVIVIGSLRLGRCCCCEEDVGVEVFVAAGEE